MRSILTRFKAARLACWALASLAISARPADAQSSCVTTDSWAPIFASYIDDIYNPEEVDSADNIAHGIPYAREPNITVVSNDSVCTAVIAALNAVPDSVGGLGAPATRAVIFDLNGTGFAVVPPDHGHIVILTRQLAYFRSWGCE